MSPPTTLGGPSRQQRGAGAGIPRRRLGSRRPSSPAFLAEELRSGLNAVPKGQTDAAISQVSPMERPCVSSCCRKALANCWQPLVTQYLNLMKLSSIASAIGLAEITYQVRQVESYNSHAFEAFAIGTAFYLLVGLALGQGLGALGPHPPGGRPRPSDPAAEKEARAAEVAEAASDADFSVIWETCPTSSGAALSTVSRAACSSPSSWRWRLGFSPWRRGCSSRLSPGCSEDGRGGRSSAAADFIRGIPLIFVIFWLYFLIQPCFKPTCRIP